MGKPTGAHLCRGVFRGICWRCRARPRPGAGTGGSSGAPCTLPGKGLFPPAGCAGRLLLGTLGRTRPTLRRRKPPAAPLCSSPRPAPARRWASSPPNSKARLVGPLPKCTTQTAFISLALDAVAFTGLLQLPGHNPAQMPPPLGSLPGLASSPVNDPAFPSSPTGHGWKLGLMPLPLPWRAVGSLRP